MTTRSPRPERALRLEPLAERAGYVRDGVMRSVHLKQGRRIDQAVWSRLPSDG